MQLFFEQHLQVGQLALHENTARHCLQVLRMKVGDQLMLTDGKGNYAEASISVADKKNAMVQINAIQHQEAPSKKIHLAIAFTKNPSRMEWLLEKVTEIGITGIIPLQTKRSERIHFKRERFLSIMTSAMLQSKQFYMPTLHEMTSFEKCLTDFKNIEQKLLAHCTADDDKNELIELELPGNETLICIGPEGDFSDEEIALAAQHQLKMIGLGATRLRTETAGLVAVTLLNFK